MTEQPPQSLNGTGALHIWHQDYQVHYDLNLEIESDGSFEGERCWYEGTITLADKETFSATSHDRLQWDVESGRTTLTLQNGVKHNLADVTEADRSIHARLNDLA